MVWSRCRYLLTTAAGSFALNEASLSRRSSSSDAKTTSIGLIISKEREVVNRQTQCYCVFMNNMWVDPSPRSILAALAACCQHRGAAVLVGLTINAVRSHTSPALRYP